MTSGSSAESAVSKAARYLSSRPRTEWEVRRYLAEKEFDVKDIDEAVREMTEDGYIDDYRYCMEYFRMAARKGRGNRRIVQELAQRGVDRNLASEVIEAFDGSCDDPFEDDGGICTDEGQRAMEVAGKMAEQQLSDGKPLDQKFKARLGRRLNSLGYPAEIIYHVINGLPDPAEE